MYLGFVRGEAAIILDHLERTHLERMRGRDSNAPAQRNGDVTLDHYDLDPLLRRKREMMWAWIEWLNKQATLAVQADPTLLDRDALHEAVYRRRYGDEAWDRRAARSAAVVR